MGKNRLNILAAASPGKHKCFLAISGIFAFFALLYRPMETAESLYPLYGSVGQIAKTCILLVLYTILSYYGITFFYYYLNRLRSGEGEKHLSYAKKALILALVWLPHVLVAYPASIPPDTEAQLMQFMGYEPFTAHHPPAHTYLAGICTQLGKKFLGSYNAGIFFCVILQYLIMVLVFAYSIHYLEKRKAPAFILGFQWVVCGLSPLVTGFVGVVLKDVIYSAFFVLFVVFCARFAEKTSFCLSMGDVIGLGASGICVVLLRNNGKYVVYPMCFVVFMIVMLHNRKDKKQWAKALSVLLLPAAVSWLVLNSLTVAFHIAPGSIREALSFPFQQTARTVSKHADELPENEIEAIDRVLNFEKIGRWYDYKISDPVKLTFKEEASKEDLVNYFGVWAKELRRYPATYFTATLMQNYPLLCLFEDNSYYYSSSSAAHEGNAIITPVPAVEKINEVFCRFYGAVHEIPVFGLIAHMSFFCILLFVLTAYVWRRKKYRILIPILPLWLSFGICILAPAVINNARYAFPICYSSPFLFGCYTVFGE